MFIFDADSLHGMDVVSVADVSEVHAASIFKDEVNVVGECKETHEKKGEGWCAALDSGDRRQGGHRVPKQSSAVC
jgi:hypothetical protein